MEKYRLAERKSVISSSGGTTTSGSDDSITAPNELRITQQGKPRNYISYAMNLLTSSNGEDDSSTRTGESVNASSGNVAAPRTVVLKAMGRAVNKAVTIAEILKRKAPLHQITSLSSCELVDIYEPLEEGLDQVQTKRYVSCMVITLSTGPLDQNNIGYQPPLSPEMMQPGDTRSDAMTV
eukprot:CAMPEP_0116033670 /NCGR_PEP_ID=MMETSP0321-20121206/19138_1 /TAXON_ID=163516 /ORGANISM="Leptocylindrus danicus var. danicus, Strain B650" /LENGTH=179 /DNA_ID=CAMNT_0003509811 /DNA_START=135 /DNA_END=674 /DNA_ORIENTATION=-